MKHTLRLVLCLSLLSLTAMGCGLADYEAKMAEAQKRVERYDNENRVLDLPVNIATHKVIERNGDKEEESDVEVAQVFFRPLRNILPVPVKLLKSSDDEQDPKTRAALQATLRLYRYSTKEGETTMVMPPPDFAGALVTDCWLMFGSLIPQPKKPWEYANAKEFVDKVCSQFPALKRGTMTAKPVPIPESDRTLDYQFTEGDKVVSKTVTERYLMYEILIEQQFVAIVYRMVGPPNVFKQAKGPPGAVALDIDISLSSLQVGAEALASKQVWINRKLPTILPPAPAATPPPR